MAGPLDRLRRRLIALAGDADSEHERAYRSTLIVVSSVTAPLVVVWSAVYGILGLAWAAVIPVAYTVVTIAGLAVVARTGRIGAFRITQMSMWLTFPFLLQASVGGFARGSAVGMWSITAPLLASVVGLRPWPWMTGFAALAVASGLVDGSLMAPEPPMPQPVVSGLFVLNFLGIAYVTFVSLRFFIREREVARVALEHERARSEGLLLNILPEQVALRLKAGEDLIADRVDAVTILFADLVDSTPMSERLPPDRLVEVLDGVFTAFDSLVEAAGLEKIKTVGDAYVAAGGLPVPRADHVQAVADLALAMRDEIGRHSAEGFGPLRMRFGIHTGSVVAGVIGRRKFAYDLWGDTVNTAARMESHSLPGEIHVTEAVYRRLAAGYRFRARGPIEVKGKGLMETWFLEGRRATGAAATDEADRTLG